jgi:hypothetical protein
MPRTFEGESPTAHQRLPEYKREEGWIRELLHRGQVAHIASRWDEQPFLTPTTYLFDEEKHRIIFHSNISGRIRSNIDRHPQVCVEVSEMGKLLPSNIALEFSLQYRSVIVFGSARILEDPNEQRELLHRLIAKYFGGMKPGRDFRPATEKELARTSVYGISIDSWSGKENWKDRADQSDEWPALDDKWSG